jgi:PKD repeat protein
VRVIETSATSTPDGQITALPSTSSISVGSSIDFNANASGGFAPYTYYWDFDGAVADFEGRMPGEITFPRQGTYEIKLYTTDARQAEDPTPDTMTITVTSVANPSAQEPTETILQPSSNVQINLGESVEFSGTATDSDSNYPLLYRWRFDGAHPTVVLENNQTQVVQPGQVTFRKTGVYQIELIATDSTGASNLNTPATRTITVLPGNGSNTGGNTGGNAGGTNIPAPGPTATITQSPNNQQISLGATVTFTANATDPNGDTNLRYRWDFDGVAPISNQQSVSVTFNQRGTFDVRLWVTNSNGVTGDVVIRSITVQ